LSKYVFFLLLFVVFFPCSVSFLALFILIFLIFLIVTIVLFPHTKYPNANTNTPKQKPRPPTQATGKRLFFPELELKRHDKSTLDPRPFVVTSGNAKDFFLKMNFCDVHISISHDQDYAFASVVINQGPPYANLNSAEAESFVVGERKDVV
jgi:hypothetical protein